MIPKTQNDLDRGFTASRKQDKTFYLDREQGKFLGMTEGLDAIKQSVYLLLNTQRYQYPIYSWNYGVELQDLIGQPKEYALPEIKRCITEALLQDDRITAVDNFAFEIHGKKVHVSFLIHTIFGNIDWEVNTDV